jgi:hypothetical protein
MAVVASTVADTSKATIPLFMIAELIISNTKLDINNINFQIFWGFFLIILKEYEDCRS